MALEHAECSQPLAKKPRSGDKSENNNIEEVEFLHVAKHIDGDNYTDIGVHLGFKSKMLKDLKKEHSKNTKEALMDIFVKWRDMQDDTVDKREVFADALEKSDSLALAEKIRENKINNNIPEEKYPLSQEFNNSPGPSQEVKPVTHWSADSDTLQKTVPLAELERSTSKIVEVKIKDCKDRPYYNKKQKKYNKLLELSLMDASGTKKGICFLPQRFYALESGKSVRLVNFEIDKEDKIVINKQTTITSCNEIYVSKEIDEKAREAMRQPSVLTRISDIPTSETGKYVTVKAKVIANVDFGKTKGNQPKVVIIKDSSGECQLTLWGKHKRKNHPIFKVGNTVEVKDVQVKEYENEKNLSATSASVAKVVA